MTSKFESFKAFCSKNSELLCILILGFFSYLFLFFNLGAYPLIDVDETRYVQIAREMFNSGNCVTPFLNYVPFLEKPPLYFWLSSISFSIFGEFSNFAARFANSFLALFIVFFTYFFGRKTLGRAFGLISALILLTNVWFLIFSHIAILDLGFMALTAASIYCALLANFCKVERNKKICWYFFYLFMGFSVLSKGLIGIIIPFGTVFLIYLLTKNIKEMFKPINFLVGLVIFALVTTPWHYLVWAQNGQLWVDDYIIKHHLARFMNSGLGLGRKQPFLFYVPIVILGFIPWIASLLAVYTKLIKNDIKAIKTTGLKSVFATDDTTRKVLLSASIWALFTFLFFSISSSKLPTYILTIFPPMALACGYYWWAYIMSDKSSRGIKITSVVTSSIFAIIGLGVIVVANFTNVPELKPYIDGLGEPIVHLGWIFLTIGILSIVFALRNRRVLLFGSYILIMFSLIAAVTSTILPFVTKFGQSELENYAKIAKENTNSTLTTFDFPSKYSVLTVYEKKINFINDEDFDALQVVMNNDGKEKKASYVIVKNKQFQNYKNIFDNFEIIEKGKKYTLLKR